MNTQLLIWFLLILVQFPGTGAAQPQDLFMPLNIKNAYLNQTRSMDGDPGIYYWQNRADYRIEVELDPIQGVLSGFEEICYYNNSPDVLSELIIHLFPNIYKKGNAREFLVDPSDETDGVSIKQILLDSENINLDEQIEYIHNDIKLRLNRPLNPNQQIKITITWQYTLNKKSHMRTGRVDSTSYFVAYFFPRVAVYDDIDGWNNFKYSGRSEFYNDFGDFDLAVTVPRHHLVWATGMLQNPGQVLSEKYQQRLQTALTSDKIIHIIDSTECLDKDITASNNKNIWRFKAENVTDVAFAISDHYLWDASSLPVDQKSGRRVLIDAAYNKHSRDFYQVAKIARQAIDFMSTQIPGVPFPYPNETVFNGLDEMEYPMMVNNMSVSDPGYLIKLTSHEIFHTYFPFYMGINETKYAWMDEGWASFGDYLISTKLDSAYVPNFYYLDTYKECAGRDLDMPMMATSIYLKRPTYHINSYAKPATFLYILQDLLGEKTFKKALHGYMDRWNGKHPTPYDFFFCFSNGSGQNLNWLFKPWFFEYGYVDLAIEDVSGKPGDYTIKIEKKGLYPSPIRLKIFYDDNSHDIVHKTADVWKDGKDQYTLFLKTDKKIKKVELFDAVISDTDPINNLYLIK